MYFYMINHQPMLYILKTNCFSPSSGCDCNNHAQRCRFDQALYEASGRRSGGVCEGCMHHTTGPKCEQCAPGYQPNPYSRMDRPDACIRKCSFSKSRLSNTSKCDSDIQAVVLFYYSKMCKIVGCGCNLWWVTHVCVIVLLSGCICSAEGTVNGGRCDDSTGSCQCKVNVEGPRCDRCKRGYHGLSASNPLGCSSESNKTPFCLLLNHSPSL